MNEVYPLRYTTMGLIYISPEDDCGSVVDAMVSTGYGEEFCIALDWDTQFIARLMKAGFLVMSETVTLKDEKGITISGDLVLPKLHLVRSALFFENLHVKRSLKGYVPRYELFFDTEFETIVSKCLQVHGMGWLTPSLVKNLFMIRKNAGAGDALYNKKTPDSEPNPFPNLVSSAFPRPVSFELYRNGELKAGEFGVICGRIYTSYSGFKTEDNAGTVQMILTARALQKAGFDFLDFGMPLPYKRDLGAFDISPEEFVSIFRAAQI